MTHEEALYVLKNTAWLGTEADWKKVEEALNVLEQPSAQPEVAKDTNVPCKDLISRQAAIRWVKTECNPYGKPTLDFESGKWVIKHLEQMPSAQPEVARRIVGKSRGGMTFWYQCDMCNEPVDVQDNFCRGCGRRLTDG